MEYQGHPSWTLWNVNLWLSNDIELNTMAREALEHGTKDEAAEELAEKLAGKKTPDGAIYSKKNLRYALGGLS
ncbi:MAG: hypothetical protein K9L68_13000 [Spirochaetales bacterium]|nr:hypothetical protein [Spirochaetales bacterium]